MNLIAILVVLGFVYLVLAFLVYIHAVNNDADSPFAWFVIVLLFGLLGFLLYVALGPDGPILKSITDEDIEEWKQLRETEEAQKRL